MTNRLEASNLWELLELRVATTPDSVMTVDEHDREMTFADYKVAAERAAAGLHDLGVREGDVVSWVMPTWMETVVLFAALARLGAIQNPILPLFRQREVAFVCGQARTSLLIVPGTWRGFDYEAMGREVQAGQPGLRLLVADPDLPGGDPSALPPAPANHAGDEQPVRWYYYTSGTTAEPKGAKHTDASIEAAAVAMCERIEITADDRIGCGFPFTHIGGAIHVYCTLAYGCGMIIAETFDAEATPPIFARHGVTLAGAGTPFFMAYLAYQRNHPDEAPIFPKARAYLGGGAAKPVQLHYEVKAELGGIGIAAAYGMTEAPVMTMPSIHDPDEALAEAEGRACPGGQLIIVTADEQPAAVDVEGEVRVKGPTLMRGYVDSSLDAAAFDDDGYFRTGDLGTVDAAGNVRITGRLKDIIIRNMENISAKEVEDLLFEHPRIDDATIIGLPDDRTGERVCAVIVPHDHEDVPTLDELLDYVVGRGLAKNKAPEQLEIMDLLPRNVTGKVLKQELRRKYTPS